MCVYIYISYKWIIKNNYYIYVYFDLLLININFNKLKLIVIDFQICLFN